MSLIAAPLDADALVRRARKEGRVLLTQVSWAAYRGFLDRMGERRARFTYDRGSLEIMPTSREHEINKWLLGRLLEVWAEENQVALSIGGEMTLDREDLDRGLRGDECYWIAHEAQVRGKTELDFATDPPQDLYLEIEVSRSVLNRLAILAALGVPEVWRWDGTTLQVGVLQPSGEYRWGDHSPAFPTLPLAEVVRFLRLANTTDHLGVVRAFRAWVREQAGRG